MKKMRLLFHSTRCVENRAKTQQTIREGYKHKHVKELDCENLEGEKKRGRENS